MFWRSFIILSSFAFGSLSLGAQSISAPYSLFRAMQKAKEEAAEAERIEFEAWRAQVKGWSPEEALQHLRGLASSEGSLEEGVQSFVQARFQSEADFPQNQAFLHRIIFATASSYEESDRAWLEALRDYLESLSEDIHPLWGRSADEKSGGGFSLASLLELRLQETYELVALFLEGYELPQRPFQSLAMFYEPGSFDDVEALYSQIGKTKLSVNRVERGRGKKTGFYLHTQYEQMAEVLSSRLQEAPVVLRLRGERVEFIDMIVTGYQRDSRGGESNPFKIRKIYLRHFPQNSENQIEGIYVLEPEVDSAYGGMIFYTLGHSDEESEISSVEFLELQQGRRGRVKAQTFFNPESGIFDPR